MIECFECGDTNNIHKHHVVPKVLGGTKTIPLCPKCHGKVHDKDFTHHARLTKIGLQKAKERGVVLGHPETLTNRDTTKANKKRSEKANKRNFELYEEIKRLEREFGSMTLRQIAEKLYEKGYKTPRGKMFQATSIMRIIKSMENEKPDELVTE